MKLHTYFAAGLLMAFTVSSAIAEDKQAPSPFKTPRERASYGIGRNIGEQLKGSGLDLDPKIVLQAITEALAGTKSVQSDDEFREAIASLEKQSQADATAKTQTFLDDNGKQKGVTTTKSGLQYMVIKPGTGKRPTPNDSVKAHYKGTFLDGKTFDSSYDRGEPAVFPLNGVIKGWTEGVPLMQVGAKYKFWIPGDLAYGPRGRPGIPPNSLLVFEIELLDVIPEGDAK